MPNRLLESLSGCFGVPVIKQGLAYIVNAIGSHVEMEYSAFQGRFQPCIHIDAVKILLSHVDALNDVSPTVEFAGMHVYMHCIYQSINQSNFYVT